MTQKLIPDPQVCKRYGIHTMTLHRWDHDPHLNFPKPVHIRKRKYRAAEELDAVDEAQAAAPRSDIRIPAKSSNAA